MSTSNRTNSDTSMYSLGLQTKQKCIHCSNDYLVPY